ncbi:hypothetical protein CEW46_21240 [Bacillus cereus]|nr:hypothetical protein CEW46_21240 [Bacillus cereus]
MVEDNKQLARKHYSDKLLSIVQYLVKSKVFEIKTYDDKRYIKVDYKYYSTLPKWLGNAYPSSIYRLTSYYSDYDMTCYTDEDYTRVLKELLMLKRFVRTLKLGKVNEVN